MAFGTCRTAIGGKHSDLDIDYFGNFVGPDEKFSVLGKKSLVNLEILDFFKNSRGLPRSALLHMALSKT